MDLSGLIVRVLHILCGVFWAGAAMMIAGFVEPAVHALGPDGGRFMQRMVGPGKLPAFMVGSAFVTSISGLALFWLGSGSRLGDWLASGYGRAIVVGAVAGLGSLVLGLIVNTPTAIRLGALGRELQSRGTPPSADEASEVGRLQARLHKASIASATLLIISVVAMAAAHYL